MKKGDKVRANYEGAPIMRVIDVRGNTLVCDGGYYHVTKVVLVAAKPNKRPA